MSDEKSSSEMQLYAADGSRLYVNGAERAAFIEVAHRQPPLIRLFCLTLVYTGCRLSEARNLKPEHYQCADGRVSFQTLKRRKAGYIREVPIPPVVCDAVAAAITAHGHHAYIFSTHARPPGRNTCYRWVKECMAEAGITGPQACPKGLRHGYGVHATQCGVQLHMLQKWMGHAAMETTAIYATALGPEELVVAGRMW